MSILDPGGGTASWGAYVLGILCFVLYLARRKEPVLRYADLLASALGLGPLIARVGCFMNGCCFGRVSDLPWAVSFPRYSFAHTAQVREGLIDPHLSLSLPVHPVQIYSSLAGLLLFLVVSRFWTRHHLRPGMTFAFYWLLYGILRFCTEFFRGDVPRYGGLPFTLSQYLSLGMIVAALWLGTVWRRATDPRSEHVSDP